MASSAIANRVGRVLLAQTTEQMPRITAGGDGFAGLAPSIAGGVCAMQENEGDVLTVIPEHGVDDSDVGKDLVLALTSMRLMNTKVAGCLQALPEADGSWRVMGLNDRDSGRPTKRRTMTQSCRQLTACPLGRFRSRSASA